MYPPGQDPQDQPDGQQGGVPPQRGGHQPGFAANTPFGTGPRVEMPMPRQVATVRRLMFVGGVCGLLFAALFVMGLAMPAEVMEEAMEETAAGAGAAPQPDPAFFRLLMVTMVAVTGTYGLLSTLLASLIPRRTLGVFWGVVLFQGAAGLLLLWNLTSGALLAVVPLGFAAAMVVLMLSRDGRAYFDLD